jgi:hypothetical protein
MSADIDAMSVMSVIDGPAAKDAPKGADARPTVRTTARPSLRNRRKSMAYYPTGRTTLKDRYRHMFAGETINHRLHHFKIALRGIIFPG